MLKINPLFSLNKWDGLHRGSRDGKRGEEGRVKTRENNQDERGKERRRKELSIHTMSTL